MVQSLTSVATRVALDRLGEMFGQTGNVSAPANMANAAAAQQTNTVQGASFDQVLADIAGSTVSKLQTAEALSTRKMAGEDVAIRDVVNSVMEAEQSLNTAIAIRDKIVQAYLEVSRMQI